MERDRKDDNAKATPLTDTDTSTTTSSESGKSFAADEQNSDSDELEDLYVASRPTSPTSQLPPDIDPLFEVSPHPAESSSLGPATVADEQFTDSDPDCETFGPEIRQICKEMQAESSGHKMAGQLLRALKHLKMGSHTPSPRRNTESRNTESRNPESRNTESRNTEFRNTERREDSIARLASAGDVRKRSRSPTTVLPAPASPTKKSRILPELDHSSGSGPTMLPDTSTNLSLVDIFPDATESSGSMIAIKPPASNKNHNARGSGIKRGKATVKHPPKMTRSKAPKKMGTRANPT